MRLWGALLALLIASTASAQTFPGGFTESQGTTTRPKWTQAQINAAVPASRGTFTFPAPYNTTGVRITDSSDCTGGQDCVQYIGYSYWRNTNAHEASTNMWIFVGLSTARGGAGPTLFQYNKNSDVLTKVGPLFTAGSGFLTQSGEQWAFTNTEPNKMYINDGGKLWRYDVVTRVFTLVYDVTTQFGSQRFIWQPHSSGDDRIHSAALYVTGSLSQSNALGCIVYNENTGTFRFFAKTGAFNECQIDKSGRYLMMQQNSHVTPAPDGDESLFIDLSNDAQFLVLDQNGGLGHADAGWGYFIGLDNWNQFAGAVISFAYPGPVKSSLPHFRSLNTFTLNPVNHVSHQNAKPTTQTLMPNQYACGSNADTTNMQNEITCFLLASTPATQLIVAPVMTNMNAAGGNAGCSEPSYCKLPKGNIDISGRYFIWTTNLGGSRLDAFMVKVPGQLLTTVPDTTPPAPPSGVMAR